MMPSSLLDEAFTLLNQATLLEQNASSANNSNTSPGQDTSDTSSLSLLQQAATKYHEACYLMKRHVGRDTPKNDDSEAAKMKRLMVDKIEYYEMHAQELMRQVKEYKKQAGNSLVNDDLGFVLQRNGSPNSSWEDKHASQLQSTRDNSMPSSKVVKDHVDNSKSTNEAAVQAAGKASVSLSSAIKFDESKEMSSAIEQYLASAQHYLEAVKILCQENEVTNSELIASLKRKVQVALDRVQELKKKQAGNKPKPDCDEIRKKLASLEPTTHKVSHTKPNCDEINRKLEQLATLEPTNNASLTPYEIEVLRKSSTLTSGLFLPWCDEEARTYNYFSHISPWTDPDGLLTLSDKQKERFYKWARPSQIVSMKRHPSRDNIAMIHSITPFTIKQYCVSDCSFVAGLCIAAAYERRFKKPILSSLIYPQDSSGKPIYNPHGVYMVKLWLNGVARRVLVDDLLPIDKKGKLLCSHTDGRLSRSQRNLLERGTPLELWVSILEKAYMKLCGGYDFPGSNSGIDLFSLTGWIPERIFFPQDPSDVKDFETPVERAWERLFSANSYGDCLITLSTSKDLTEEKASEVGLYTAHAYAVLGVHLTSNGTRLLQLKNPWASEGWLGRYSARDEYGWSDPNFCAEVGYNATSAKERDDDGVFYISWDDVLIYFRNLHLSWNPALFRHKTTMHGCWKKEQGPNDDSFNVGENPQYVVSLSTNAVKRHATLWILLTRHVTKQEQEGGEVSDYLTLHIHRISSSKQRVWYPGGGKCVLTGAYTNNQHVLIRYDAEGLQDKYLSLVLSQHKKSNDLCYTISCYCTEKFKLNEPEEPLPFCKVLESAWELRDNASPDKHILHVGTAGGPPGKGSFGANPQWSVVVINETIIQFKCMAKKSLAVNVMLVQTGFVSNTGASPKPTSKRVHHLYESPIVDSGDYRHGFVVTERTLLPAGFYTLILSTFEVGQVGRFILHVMSEKQVFIDEIK